MSTDDTLEMRQRRAKELRQSTIRAPTMNDLELADLRADIKVDSQPIVEVYWTEFGTIFLACWSLGAAAKDGAMPVVYS